MVYVNYTIDKEGIVKDIKSNAGLVGVVFEDNEAKNIMSKAFEDAASSIIKELPKMKPAIIDSVAVDTKFRTPIMYKLSDLGSYSEESVSKLPIVSISNEKIEKALKFLKTNSMSNEMFIIEDVPLFPGCKRVAKSKRRDCFQEKMNQHIRRNFRYPEKAQEMGIQGRVFVQFMIGKDGDISGIRTRGPHSILEREANRIISLLPKMTPGTQKGRPVRVPFSIPIQFILR
ncbi:MAG: TonB family protein [Flavobacteriaceae bacterium]|nr:TonB family protein [Flavobacteriaceae bacterium]